MKTTITLVLLILCTLVAQPGKPQGPGGQYGERMEMMLIWKLTDHLELTKIKLKSFSPVCGRTKNRF